MKKTIITRPLTKDEYQELRDQAKKFGLKINIRNDRGYVSVYPTKTDGQWAVDMLYAVYVFLNEQKLFMFESCPVTCFQRYTNGFTNLSKVINHDVVKVNMIDEVLEEPKKDNVIQFPIHRVKSKAQ